MCPARSRAETRSVSDFKSTLNLPSTALAMRPGLAALEPELMRRWGEDNGYKLLRKDRAGAPSFTLHDGPPYANGHLHLGHALNKVLKDMLCRGQRALGKDARLRPGWDCHGLPVEWKVEEAFRASGRSREEVPVLEFRQACRDYAQSWVNTQRQEFMRLGVAADWTAPYLTMDHGAEAAVAAEFLKLVGKGLVYRDLKPVLWSPVEQTSLAEAEVEYHDRKCTAAWVGYRVRTGSLAGAALLAWTTTPWTLPASVALAASPTLEYGLYTVERQTDVAWVEPADMLVLADLRVQPTEVALRAKLKRLRDVSHEELASLQLALPLSSKGAPWDQDLPCVLSDHVTADAGTGLVHTAPAHGPEDHALGRRLGLPSPLAVDASGLLLPRYGDLAGHAVVNADGKDGSANEAVLQSLLQAGTLMGRGTLTHSASYSWRSKAPLFYQATPQWFVGVDLSPHEQGSLREQALRACQDVQWLPEGGQARMTSMLNSRPDWLVSRQRAWGVPLPLFTRVDLDPSDPDFLLRDPNVDGRVLDAFAKEGSDAWYMEGAKERFLSSDHDPDRYEQCMDVLDVWFDSGTSHSFALDDDTPVSDLCVEGTDQHRGWFQHSLLYGVATKGQAPFRAVMTHGFALDGKGRKMSKSAGNTVEPETLVAKYGADVLRLWVSTTDTSQDFRAGDETFKGAQENYRKLRNTVRFLMGVLEDRACHPLPDRTELPLLERWLLNEVAVTNTRVQQGFASFDMPMAVQAVLAFCTRTLSAVYLDVRKDALYCDTRSSPTRTAALGTLSVCLSALRSWLTPVLPFSMGEVQRTLGEGDAAHAPLLPETAQYLDQSATMEMDLLLHWRDTALPLLEELRKTGEATRSETMRLVLSGLPEKLDLTHLARLCLVSEVLSAEPGEQSRAEPDTRASCPRCRKVTTRLVPAPGYGDCVCPRCQAAL